MSQKTAIWIGAFVGSTLGSYVPALWGDNALSLSAIALTFVGGLIGIWIGYRLGQ